MDADKIENACSLLREESLKRAKEIVSRLEASSELPEGKELAGLGLVHSELDRLRRAMWVLRIRRNNPEHNSDQKVLRELNRCLLPSDVAEEVWRRLA